MRLVVEMWSGIQGKDEAINILEILNKHVLPKDQGEVIEINTNKSGVWYGILGTTGTKQKFEEMRELGKNYNNVK
jgi:hypothetical protein